ncbi:MBL fold metallo-hydrolase [Pseudoroseomonas wenyumeiae]
MRDNLLWTGGSLSFIYKDREVRSHISVYALKGSEKIIMVDTGHPSHWDDLELDIDRFLDGRSLDFIFLTHIEFPHIGLLPNWMRKFPDVQVYGMVSDLFHYFPDEAHRFHTVAPGDFLDLGDTKFVFVPAVWRDMNNTLWGFETRDRTLFVADAYGYMHYHDKGETDVLSSERPVPDLEALHFLNERALYWTKYADTRETFGSMDSLLDVLRPHLIAPAHGGVVDTLPAMNPLIKQGMMMMKLPA